MMNWSTRRVQQAHFLRLYQTLPWRTLRVTAGLVGLGALVLLVTHLIRPNSPLLLGLGLFFLGPAGAIGLFHLYIDDVRSRPGLAAKNADLLSRADFPLLWVLERQRRQRTLAVLLQALLEEPSVAIILYRLGVNPKLARELFGGVSVPDEVLVALFNSAEDASVFGLLRALPILKPFDQFLDSQKITRGDWEALVAFYQDQHRVAEAARTPWRQTHHLRIGGFAKDWSVSYTTLLDQYTAEIGPAVVHQEAWSPLLGRAKLVDQIISELTKTAGQNVLLVGESGVGKQEITYHLASRVVTYQTKTDLDGCHVLQLDVAALTITSPERLEALLAGLFEDIVRSGRVILLIDGLDSLLQSEPKVGTSDLSAAFERYLNHENVHIIGTLTQEAYLRVVKPRRELAEQFSVVEVPPPDGADLEVIVLSHLGALEHRYQTFFLLGAIRSLIQLAGRYLKEHVSPRREIELAEKVAATVHQNGRTLVEEADVTAAVEQIAQVPIQVDKTERETLLHLAAKLRQRIVGQSRAIEQVSDALLRARAGLASGTKPIGSFLFLGPTGVGKTETAKALAAIYFGSEQKLIRLDLTEFADETGLQKLLGTSAERNPGALTVAIQSQPSAVVLFDEIEKAHPLVRNVFLQLLDEGKLTTNFGKVLDFSNTIVIATSNAGSDLIKQSLAAGLKMEQVEKQLINSLIDNRVFLPEFLNRFDGTIVFSALTREEMRQIVQLQLGKMAVTLKTQKGIDLTVAPAVLDQLVSRGYDPVFGARALERVLQNDLGTAVARQIMTENSQPGSSVIINSL